MFQLFNARDENIGGKCKRHGIFEKLILLCLFNGSPILTERLLRFIENNSYTEAKEEK